MYQRERLEFRSVSRRTQRRRKMGPINDMSGWRKGEKVSDTRIGGCS